MGSKILKDIEEKWNKKWYEEHAFETEHDERKKYFLNFPYPYMNGYLHLGHLYTLMKLEIMARYKKMRDYNVLFPFSFHCTGTPIIAAAERIKEGEEKEWNIMRMMGIPDEEIKKFSDPVYWTQYFPKEAKKDLMSLGCSIDFRHSFITTNLNPRYSKFVKWQFRKLKELGYVTKGEHPVVWCPNCKSPVGDHARLKGEGVRPEKMFLIKFNVEGRVLPCATYRPETTFGVTNIWINPNVEYAIAKVDGEEWIVSKSSVEKLKDQKHKVDVIGRILGSELINKKCSNKLRSDVPILPAEFVDPEVGTGVVMSVPAHAPYDYIALKDLGVDIKPISLIKVDGFGEFPAIEIVERMKINNQKDSEKLEQATKEIYKKEFHTGVLKDITGKYKEMKVSEAKELIANDFRNEDLLVDFWELPEEVICRCLTRTHVKIVDDQWFLKYSDPNWKKRAHEALARMSLYPEVVRKQFDYVIDWLNDWACTREFGLGTPLPWDKKWIIESLSDSTIYMSMYTIWHILKNVPEELIDDDLFDYVFLGKGDKKKLVERGIDERTLDKMRNEFDYWYPFDLRNSGKDLIQNHLAFCLFNHVAIFPEDKWPRAFGLNGHIMVNGEKMSKSKGNFKTIRDMVKEFGVSPLRLSIALSGEGIDDANFDTELTKSLTMRIENLLRFLTSKHETSSEWKVQDEWFEAKIDNTVADVESAMESMMFKTAASKCFFDLQNDLKFYSKWRGTPNDRVLRKYIDVQTKLLYPFIPHVSSEVMEKLSLDGNWPSAKRVEVPKYKKYVETVMNDLKSVKKLAKGEHAKIFVAEDWKFDVIGKDFAEAKSIIEKHVEKSMIGKMLKMYKNGSDLAKSEQMKVLKDSKDFIEKETGLSVEILDADEGDDEKARASTPKKPGILLW